VPYLLPLAGKNGILGAALSGAGPAILVIVDSEASLPQASAAIREAQIGFLEPELVVCRFETGGTVQSLDAGVR
jgi:homoserine kinase